jgi:hypothetical protein
VVKSLDFTGKSKIAGCFYPGDAQKQGIRVSTLKNLYFNADSLVQTK